MKKQEPKVSEIVKWWEDRNSILILNESPQDSNPLAKIVTQAMAAPLYTLELGKITSKNEILYSWDKDVQASLLQQTLDPKLSIQDFNQAVYQKETMVLGLLAQALEDPNENVVVAIDGLDTALHFVQALLLEFLLDAAITIPELNICLFAKSGKRPHIIIKTQAKAEELKDSFSPIILRRSRYVSLLEEIGN